MTEKRVTKEQFDALAKKVDQGIKSGDFWLDAEDWLVILGALMLASQRAEPPAEGEPVESTDFKRISIAERDAWLADHPEEGRNAVIDECANLLDAIYSQGPQRGTVAWTQAWGSGVLDAAEAIRALKQSLPQDDRK